MDREIWELPILVASVSQTHLEMAWARSTLSIGEGWLLVDRGYLRPENEPAVYDPELGSHVDSVSTEGLKAGAAVQGAAISFVLSFG
jgi:hypothetical protein